MARTNRGAQTSYETSNKQEHREKTEQMKKHTKRRL